MKFCEIAYQSEIESFDTKFKFKLPPAIINVADDVIFDNYKYLQLQSSDEEMHPSPPKKYKIDNAYGILLI